MLRSQHVCRLGLPISCVCGVGGQESWDPVFTLFLEYQRPVFLLRLMEVPQTS